MEKETSKEQSKGFAVPLELVKAFGRDLRFTPQMPPGNGYIVFDMDMLISVLRGKNAEAGKLIADGLEKSAKTGGKVVLMG